ncbi:NAD(P)H-dependent oxidoreductase [Plasticicumulans acidivorans]|uniref:Putative NADPH-quinone reductase n=1 Tax=Plasticicumulans acidivorans TaxID=886464 RepID=A0A317MVA4_9GAMM|nr:NAD(P)H-dependent oxidoreductase [Plasticicumulans acidivorans]PWV61061.1 putative NADPH-quinone reductase [Plasticicumulans acidivorans]
MAQRIVILVGHPDPNGLHYGAALAQAYADGARSAGHHVDYFELARLEFPMLHNGAEWGAEIPPALAPLQAALGAADHLLLVYPLWFGDMPALTKGLLEQLLRPGFAFTPPQPGQPGKKLLRGRSARIVVTMGMPAWLFRWFFGALSLRSLRRNVFAFVGIAPVRSTLIGSVEAISAADRGRWLERLRQLGRAAR